MKYLPGFYLNYEQVTGPHQVFAKKKTELKKKEDKKLTGEQAVKKIQTLKKDLFNIRFKRINGQVENPAQYNEIKKKLQDCIQQLKIQNDKKI